MYLHSEIHVWGKICTEGDLKIYNQKVIHGVVECKLSKKCLQVWLKIGRFNWKVYLLKDLVSKVYSGITESTENITKNINKSKVYSGITDQTWFTNGLCKI